MSVYIFRVDLVKKIEAWLEPYQRLLNVEFDWDPDHLSDEPPVEDPPSPISTDMVKTAISQMKTGKAPGPSGIMVMIRAAGDTGASVASQLQSSGFSLRNPFKGTYVSTDQYFRGHIG